MKKTWIFWSEYSKWIRNQREGHIFSTQNNYWGSLPPKLDLATPQYSMKNSLLPIRKIAGWKIKLSWSRNGKESNYLLDGSWGSQFEFTKKKDRKGKNKWTCTWCTRRVFPKLGAQKVFFIIRRSWKTTLPKYLKMDIEKSP